MNRMRLAAHLATPACIVASVALWGPTACDRAPEPPPPAPTDAAAPKPPVVRDEAGPYVLRYFAPSTGNLLVARTVNEVPEAARGQVLVSPDDPALQGHWLFVADLSRKEGDSYAVRVVDRFSLEREVAAARPAPSAPTAGGAAGEAPGPGSNAAAAAGATAGQPQAILYKTAWCGYCRKAAEYMKLNGIPFVERDLERDAGARADMLSRASQAGVAAQSLGGVPVIWIKGRIMSGFSREAIDRAWAG